MTMGKRKQEGQEAFWIPASDAPERAGRPFHRWLRQLLAEHGFDTCVQGLCEKSYAHKAGRPSIPAERRWDGRIERPRESAGALADCYGFAARRRLRHQAMPTRPTVSSVTLAGSGTAAM